MRCFPKFNFSLTYFCNETIWLAHHSKKMKVWGLLKIEGSILNYRVHPLLPTYIGEKEDNICQSIWYKSEVLWKTCWGTHWGTWRTWLKRIGNQGKVKKILPPPLQQIKARTSSKLQFRCHYITTKRNSTHTLCSSLQQYLWHPRWFKISQSPLKHEKLE
jgi:hypothetical protein